MDHLPLNKYWTRRKHHNQHASLSSHVYSQLIHDLINGESEFVKELDFFTRHHLTHADSPDAPSEVGSQKEAIFRNVDDIKSFHSKWANLLMIGLVTYVCIGLHKCLGIDYHQMNFLHNFVCRTFFPKLSDCETDDDIAMSFLKNKEGFEKYLQYLVGQSLAESAVSDKIVHRFFKVTQLFSDRTCSFISLWIFLVSKPITLALKCKLYYFPGVQWERASQCGSFRSTCAQHQHLHPTTAGKATEVQGLSQGESFGTEHAVPPVKISSLCHRWEYITYIC